MIQVVFELLTDGVVSFFLVTDGEGFSCEKLCVVSEQLAGTSST